MGLAVPTVKGEKPFACPWVPGPCACVCACQVPTEGWKPCSDRLLWAEGAGSWPGAAKAGWGLLFHCLWPLGIWEPGPSGHSGLVARDLSHSGSSPWQEWQQASPSAVTPAPPLAGCSEGGPSAQFGELGACPSRKDLFYKLGLLTDALSQSS